MDKKLNKSKTIILWFAICLAILTLSTAIFGFTTLNMLENEDIKAETTYVEETVIIDNTKYIRIYSLYTGGEFYQYCREDYTHVITFENLYSTKIEMPEQLKILAYEYDTIHRLVSHLVLGGNLDMSQVSNMKPIGTSANPFCGLFDGNGYTISNLSINYFTTYVSGDGYLGAGYTWTQFYKYYCGLFGFTQYATIKNLRIKSFDWKLTCNNYSSGFYAGLLVAKATDSLQISNCMIEDCSMNFVEDQYVQSSTAQKYTAIGGLVGEAEECIITNCAVKCNISSDRINHSVKSNTYIYGEVTSKSELFIGGFVGQGISVCEIKNSYFIGDIDIKSEYILWFGGIAGHLGNSSVIARNFVQLDSIKINNRQYKEMKVQYKLYQKAVSNVNIVANTGCENNYYYIENNNKIISAYHGETEANTGSLIEKTDFTSFAGATSTSKWK